MVQYWSHWVLQWGNLVLQTSPANLESYFKLSHGKRFCVYIPTTNQWTTLPQIRACCLLSFPISSSLPDCLHTALRLCSSVRLRFTCPLTWLWRLTGGPFAIDITQILGTAHSFMAWCSGTAAYTGLVHEGHKNTLVLLKSAQGECQCLGFWMLGMM